MCFKFISVFYFLLHFYKFTLIGGSMMRVIYLMLSVSIPTTIFMFHSFLFCILLLFILSGNENKMCRNEESVLVGYPKPTTFSNASHVFYLFLIFFTTFSLLRILISLFLNHFYIPPQELDNQGLPYFCMACFLSLF